MTVKICLLKSNNDFDIEYTYIVPAELQSEIDVGVFVDVPFGNGNSCRKAVVVEVDSAGDFLFKDGEQVYISSESGKKAYFLKEINGIVRNRAPLAPDLVLLCKKIRDRYFCTGGKAVGLMLPPELPRKAKEKYVRLCISRDEAKACVESNFIKNIKQIRLLEALSAADENELTAEELKRDYDILPSVIKAVAAKDLIIVEEREPSCRKNGGFYSDGKLLKECRTACSSCEKTYPEKILNEEQQAALEKITACIEKGDGSGLLLHGVTGSGKTEVYLHAIDRVLELGGSAAVLVPEISLTPQIVERFKGRFGDSVAVLHSRLTPAEKRREYERISSGRARIVIGARSAVFAPCRDLKLIILDEEHEPSYKSFDSVPYYRADEVAFMRAEICGAAVVLGSATPRVTSYYLAQKGLLEYARLTKRASGGALPAVSLINMRDEMKKGNFSVFSDELYALLKKNYAAGKQTILFVQRRGFSGRLVCGGCGKAMACKRCRVPMTFHRKQGRLVCHYCGNTVVAPEKCPSCGSSEFDRRNIGTEMLEAELNRLFPGAAVIRMDADTTTGKDRHRQLLERFEKENIPFLIGTQMIAKGLDFPNVTLVGVVNADGLLNIQEYGAGERTFQLLTQVFGRAGRSETPGRGVLQTMSDDEFVYACALRQDYNSFYNNEIEFRRSMNYPPFAVLCTVSVSGIDDRAAFSFISGLCDELKQYVSENESEKNCEVYNVSRAPIPKINDRYRWNFILKTARLDEMLSVMEYFSNEVLRLIRPELKQKFRVSFDIDGVL